jgi:DNA-binding Lrp family transcriptional regulator
MATEQLIHQEAVKSSAKLLSILSKKDNLTMFILAKDGIKSESNTLQHLGLSRKVYYTRLRQLIDAGLINKSKGAYSYTTLGDVIYQRHIVELIEEMKNMQQMKMIDTLKRSKEFSEDDITNFVNKIIGISSSVTGNVSSRIEIAWTYQDMVSAIVERVQFCKNEILLASRSFNEIIINNILRKSNSGINVKVITDSSLVKQYFGTEARVLSLNDKNSTERKKVVSNPWYPSNVNRRIGKIPFSIIVLDGKEVGLEIVDWNEPKKFYGVLFIREEKTSNIMLNFYNKMWDAASEEETVLGAKDITSATIKLAESGSIVAKRYI